MAFLFNALQDKNPSFGDKGYHAWAFHFNYFLGKLGPAKKLRLGACTLKLFTEFSSFYGEMISLLIAPYR